MKINDPHQRNTKSSKTHAGICFKAAPGLFKQKHKFLTKTARFIKKYLIFNKTIRFKRKLNALIEKYEFAGKSLYFDERPRDFRLRPWPKVPGALGPDFI